MKSRDHKGRFKPGASGNPTGRPQSISKRINELLTNENILYEGDDLEYINKHIRAFSEAGRHDEALKLVIETLSYRQPKIGNVSAQQEDKDYTIKFEAPDPIEKDHPLTKLIDKE